MRYLFAIIIPIFILACVYAGWRLYGFLKLLFPNLKRIAFWIIYSLFPLCFILSAYIPVSNFAKLITNTGYIYLSFLMYALFFLLFAEIIRLLFFWFRRLPKEGEQRRKVHIITGSVICVLLVALVGGGIINAYSLDTVKYDIDINKPSEITDLKVAVVSDTHFGYQFGASQAERIADEINDLHPDIVFFVGDIFDGAMDKVFDLTRIEVNLAKIESKYGVFACLGNHDIYSPKLEEFFAESNITLLTDETVLIDDNFYITGRNDRNLLSGVRRERACLSDLLKDIDTEKPLIVLDHRPDEIEEAAENKADLLICGHTHGGQMFPINLITENIYYTDYGYAEYKDMQMIVTSGTGLWGPPVRIGTNAEVAAINIKFLS